MAVAATSIFTKSGKKTSAESRDKYTSKRLSRFLSRETLESDGYDRIEEFDEPEIPRSKVKRQPSRASLKMDLGHRRDEEPHSGVLPPELPLGGARRGGGMLRREMTELDFRGYMQARGQQQQQQQQQSGGQKLFGAQGVNARPWEAAAARAKSPLGVPLWGRERALSPLARALSPVRGSGGDGGRFPSEENGRFPGGTRVLPSEHRESRSGSRGAAAAAARDKGFAPAAPPPDRYPSLDLRNDKRKSLYETDLLIRQQLVAGGGGGSGGDYRRRSYHELSDIDRIDQQQHHHHGGGGHNSRNFQHSGRKATTPAEASPTAAMIVHGRNGYKHIPEPHRYPGLDRDNAARMNPLGPLPFKPAAAAVFHHNHRSGPLSFERPAMYRHSYADPSPPGVAVFPRGVVTGGPPAIGGRFGLASLKPY
jgi:hypothetical protein